MPTDLTSNCAHLSLKNSHLPATIHRKLSVSFIIEKLLNFHYQLLHLPAILSRVFSWHSSLTNFSTFQVPHPTTRFPDPFFHSNQPWIVQPAPNKKLFHCHHQHLCNVASPEIINQEMNKTKSCLDVSCLIRVPIVSVTDFAPRRDECLYIRFRFFQFQAVPRAAFMD